MARAFYDNFKDETFDPGSGAHGSQFPVDWVSNNIKCVLVDTGTYTFSAAHQDHADLSGILATSANLTITVSVVAGVATVNVTAFTLPGWATTTGEALVYYKDSGTSATSPLIYFDDAADGLPITGNGEDVTVTAASGIIEW